VSPARPSTGSGASPRTAPHEDTTTPAETSETLPALPTRRRPALAAALAIALTVGGAGLFFALVQPDAPDAADEGAPTFLVEPAAGSPDEETATADDPAPETETPSGPDDLPEGVSPPGTDSLQTVAMDFDSIPSAIVFLDGEEIGRTPIEAYTLPATGEEIEVRFERSGYHPVRQRLVAEDGETVRARLRRAQESSTGSESSMIMMNY
jgi:hypothetical protein